MKKIRTALAGFGSGGRIYNAPVISSVPGFSIDMILTSNPENIRVAKEDFPTARIVGDISEITANPDIELVIILLPNHLHYEAAKTALLAGKNVVVEKPFTATVKEADELIQLARKNDLLLSVNHNRRWDSEIQTIEKLLAEKKLGEIVEYESHFDRFRNKVKDSWKEDPELPGSGILFDLGSHLIDQALMLFGNPSEVFADIRTQRKGARVPDKFEILMFYPGLRVSLNAGMLVKEKGPSYSIFGSRGSYIKYGADVQEEDLKNGKKPQDEPHWGEEPEEFWGKLNTLDEEIKLKSEPGNYRKFYENIYHAFTEKEELLVTPEQARDVIKVIELACQSHSSKRVLEFK